MGGQSEIKYIGVKPGEKMYEELVNDEEIRRTVDYGDFLRISPLFEMLNTNEMDCIDRAFNSANESKLSVDAISEYITLHGLIN